MQHKSIILITLLAFSTGIFAQVEIKTDTTLTTEKQCMDSISVMKNTILSIEYLPAAHFYTDEWRNEHTRSAYIFRKDTTYILPLNNDKTGSFVFPCDGKVCSSYGLRSGRMHTGMDIKQNHGDPIVAAWNGVVRMARMAYYGYGGIVVIRHDNGLETVYAHLSRVSVLPNQEVKAGELIGKAGRTGRASTEHLHFETRFLYECFNPKTIIDFDTYQLTTDTLIVVNGKFYAKEDYDNNKNQVDEIPVSSDILNDTLNINDTTDDSISIVKNKPIVPQKENAPPPTTYKPKYHIVKQGDTLYKIAKKYSTTVNKLCEINRIKENDILSLNQKIKLP